MKNLIFISFTLGLFLYACKSDDKVDISSYQTDEMLKHIGNELILKRYQNLRNSVDNLKESIASLNEMPNETNLEIAQDKFITVYTNWQKTSFFTYFGPAENNALSSLNSFPTNSSKINNNILQGAYDLDSGANTDAVGFPAIDYLLFYGETEEVLNKISSANFVQYLLDLSDHISSHINNVEEVWKNDYLTDFLEANGTDAGSSISNLANSMIHDFEAGGREAKIGIPTGVRTLGEVIPQNVEAYYSGHSILLAKEHIEAMKELFVGKNDKSFKSVLIDVNEEDLANKIISQMEEILSSLDHVADPFSESLILSNENALLVYDEYQKLLPLLKVDMTAALGLLINYVDSDGD